MSARPLSPRHPPEFTARRRMRQSLASAGKANKDRRASAHRARSERTPATPIRWRPSMAVKSDIEIAREAKKKPIQQIGAGLGIGSEHLLPFGHDKAKVSAEFIKSLESKKSGKLILVTAINPTPAG